MEQPSATSIDETIAAFEAALRLDEEQGREQTLARYIEAIPGLSSLPFTLILDRFLDPNADSSPSLGDYVLLDEIGRDENSRRLRGRGPSGENVVIRVFAELGDLGTRARALLEAELSLASSLDEARLVDVIAIFDFSGILHVVEREPTGPSLESRCRELEAGGGPSASERRGLLRQVAEIARLLDRAHELGIVHGRLQPGAILLEESGPRMQGLGLAALENVVPLRTTLTELAYRSPEQLGENLIRTDRRADIWALGAIAHRIVTGRPPIPAATEAELRREAARFVPRSPGAERVGLPVGINAVINAAVAPERRRRYGSAKELAEDIERALAGAPPLAQRPNLGNRFLRWMRREPGIAAGGFVVFALLGTAALVTGWFIGVSDRDRAVLPLEARIAAETRLRAEEGDAARELEKDRALGRRIEEIAVMTDVLRCDCFGPVAADRLLGQLVRAYRDRGIELEDRPDITAVAAILDGAHARSALDARRLLAGLYRAIDLIETLRGGNSVDSAEEDPTSRLSLIDRNVTILIERCETDSAFRHLWRVARHGDPLVVDRYDAFLDPGHWRKQSPDYLIFLAGRLGRYPERADAAVMLIDQAVRHHADSRLLQVLHGSVTLEHALLREPPDVDGQREAALHLEIAVALAPRSAPARALLATIQALNGDYRAALQNIDEATRLEPDSALIWLMRSAFFKRSPMGDRAREAAERALELDPSLEPARQILDEVDSGR